MTTSNDFAALQVHTQPISLRLPPDSAIFGVRGEVWITQERVSEDFFLGPGQRFNVRSANQLVISATHGAADLFIERPAGARAHAFTDIYDFARNRAIQLRREELAHLAEAAAAWLSGAAGWARNALAWRSHVATH